MKISSQDICEELKKEDGKTWRYSYKYSPKPFFCGEVKDNPELEPTECRTALLVDIKWHKFPGADGVRKLFADLDWAEIYTKAKETDIERETKSFVRKTYNYEDENAKYTLIIPKRIEKIIINKLEKNNKKIENNRNK